MQNINDIINIIYHVLVIILFIAIVYAIYLDNFDKKAIENFTSRVDNSRCKKFTTDEQPSLSNLNPDTLMYSMKDLRKCDEARYEHVSTSEDNNKFDYLLRDYYIKSSYNSCATDKGHNDYIDLCALENVLKEGVRCVDFQIYYMNDNPIIGTSRGKSNFIKESSNHVLFIDAMTMISEMAFGSPSPNSNDPFIINLRIMSENIECFNRVGEIIKNKIPQDKLIQHKSIPKKYKNEEGNYNMGDIPIKKCLNKVIIAVHTNSKSTYESSQLKGITNIYSGKHNMRIYENKDILNDNRDEIQKYNKQNISYTHQTKTEMTGNMDSAVHLDRGCQLIGMSFQFNDDALKHYNDYFKERGTAFVLKPCNLRGLPKILNLPDKQDEKLSYGRNTKDLSPLDGIPIPVEL